MTYETLDTATIDLRLDPWGACDIELCASACIFPPQDGSGRSEAAPLAAQLAARNLNLAAEAGFAWRNYQGCTKLGKISISLELLLARIAINVGGICKRRFITAHRGGWAERVFDREARARWPEVGEG